jgi:dipeptidyl aminopeptidase/acylaminoacyl peptidase
MFSDEASENVFWLEGRPAEAGRVCIVRSSSNGSIADVTPQPFNARTRAHEYGGGAYFVHEGSVFFSNFVDQRLYRHDRNAGSNARSNAGSNAPRPITPEPAQPAAVRYADGRVTPDGKRLICIRERHESSGEVINEIVALPADGAGPPEIIVSGADFYSSPRISRDGRLAWLQWSHPQMPWDGTELWADHRRVAGGPSESIFQPEWSPDGILHFISDRTGWWNLYAVTGGEASPVAPMDAEFGLPQWVFGLSRYAFLSAGRIACVYSSSGLDYIGIVSPGAKRVEALPSPYSTFGNIRSDGGNRLGFIGASPSRAAEVAVMDVSTNELRVLRRSMQVDVDPGYISSPEPIEFPTSNGLTAFALFYPPQNKDFSASAGERPPLLVLSHGGPTGATSSSFKLSIQYWTSRGFAVVDVNYGGSSGYGRAYRQRLNGNWGVVDVEDCINAARFLEKRGDADGSRMAIRGGSAGGYTTLCALVFSNTFAAGASYYGVADLTALAKDTHKFESRYLDGLIGPYPEAAELYEKRSPINYADQLSCPVILLQGLEDKVVPPSQAEIMIRALRARRLPFAYVPFPTEAHGFREAANIQRAAESELYFYCRVFGFTPADDIPAVEMENL